MTDLFNIRQELVQLWQAFANQRLRTIQTTIQEIETSLTSETKSSAGDKHETGRAMLQLEREKAGQQLAEVEKLNWTLSRIKINHTSEQIGLGSVVFTTNANYFIAISAGELKCHNYKFFAISINTPIAKELLGQKEGDKVAFRGQHFEIKQVL